MAANVIDFITSLVYGNPGGGAKNHLKWTLDRLASPPPSSSKGDDFLAHHVDVMLNRYEAWRSTNFLPPVRPWDGTNVFPDPMMPPMSPAMPASLSGGPFPAGWTTNNLGNAVEGYYNALRNFVDPGSQVFLEMDDEIKAPYSYRYWAFIKWVSDLRKRLLGEPVFPVGTVYDRDGTILSEKEFCDFFNQVHHIWHENAGAGAPPAWTDPTPGWKTSVGQHRRKKQISRAQIGAEFFAFHRDHLLVFDRWLGRTGQDPIQSINLCGHDSPTPIPAPPAGLDVVGEGLGYPQTNYVTGAPNFSPVHNDIWDGSRAGTDGTLREFSSAGEMGQFIALDFNPFPQMPNPPGTVSADKGYHGEGHQLNGDIAPPWVNNFVPRFFAWHGFLDDIWAKRQPAFTAFAPADFAVGAPPVLTIVRDLDASTDTVEPATAIVGLDRTTGNGTLRVRVAVRPDPFNRSLELELRCEVLREAAGPAPVISLPPRTLTMTVGAPTSASERQQGVDFVEEFVFDGSAGTTDAGGKGPFAADNTVFPPAGPSSTGFVNSLIRVTGRIVAKQRPDGSTPAAPGTISSSGTTITGSGTGFTAVPPLKDGDLIRAAGQVRAVTAVSSATVATVLDPFSPALPAGTTYERLDGFDAEERIEIQLVQEQLAPDVSVFLDRSSFSKDQVDAIAAAGKSTFENAFYLAIQDRTARPVAIVWPPDTEPALFGLLAPPIRAAGLYIDLAHAPKVELVDAATNASLAGQVDVSITAVSPEDPLLHPSIPQRVTYTCRVVFTGNGVFAGMNPGDVKEMKLKVTAVDRAGNQVIDDSSRVRLQVSANPYMLDGPISWLSIDARVFQVREGQARFGVAAGWTNPNTFIKQVIDNLRAGNGTAGGDSFDGLPTDQAGAALEYSTQVGGVNVYNFALAKVRLQSVTGATDVRASFRLFRWGTANVSFDNTLAYRSDPGGIALLGRTTTNELASIPYFAEPRVPITAATTTQADPKNLASFGPTGPTEALLFYGAYLDINQTALQFPQTWIGDGPFNAVPASDMRSIRDLLIGNHQCMIVELVYAPDPTVAGATPGTSDNLSQRNLLILQTANPGTKEITRTVQHSFDVDVTRRWKRSQALHPVAPPEVIVPDDTPGAVPFPQPARPAPAGGRMTMRQTMLAERRNRAALRASSLGSDGAAKQVIAAGRAAEAERRRWQFDLDEWKAPAGVDELLFLWNKLPRRSIVDIYFPGANVEEMLNYRNLRHAPGTVKIIDSHTLRLVVSGATYVPVPPFWGNHLSGLVTITLPTGTKAGQKYTVDVVHVRSDTHRVLGGFQLNIQVGKAAKILPAERRLQAIFAERLKLTPRSSRWFPILEREAGFVRQRVAGLAQLAKGSPKEG